MNTQTESERQRELTILQQSDTDVTQGGIHVFLEGAHELKIRTARGKAEGSSCKQRLETDERKYLKCEPSQNSPWK
jgi:hypothetical protein